MEQILNSDNAFNFFQESIFKSTFPVVKLPSIGNLNQTSVINLEKYVQKEIRQLKQSFNIRLDNQMDVKLESINILISVHIILHILKMRKNMLIKTLLKL